MKDSGVVVPDALSEDTEMEYLQRVVFEYMMEQETKTVSKVLTSMIKFPPDQAQRVLEKEDSRTLPWQRFSIDLRYLRSHCVLLLC